MRDRSIASACPRVTSASRKTGELSHSFRIIDMSRTAISCGDNNERAVCAVAHRTRVGSEPPAVGIAAGFFFFCLLVGSRGQHPEQHAACGGATVRGCSGRGRRSPSRVLAAAAAVASKKAVSTFFMLFVFLFFFASPHYALPPGSRNVGGSGR